jgi:hypothetical protein
VKDFFRFVAATSRGLIDHGTGQITADSLNAFGEWFFSSFTRVTKTATDEKERSEVYNVSPLRRGERSHSESLQWVRKTLVTEGVVVNKRRSKHNFTVPDLTCVLTGLWTKDDLIFIPERYRIQFTFIFRVYCHCE